jgi:hypothetical protein
MPQDWNYGRPSGRCKHGARQKRDLFLERRRWRIIETTVPRGCYGDNTAQAVWVRLPAMLSSKPVVLCALIIDLLPAPLFAQITRMPLQDNAGLWLPATPNDRVVVDKGDSKPSAGDKKMCSLQPFPGMPILSALRACRFSARLKKSMNKPVLP